MQVAAPANLDDETRLEWEKWVGRTVKIKAGVMGKVVGIRRRTFHNEEAMYDEEKARAIRIRAEMDGDLWWAVRRWPDAKGRIHSDLVALSGLQPVFADQRTRLMG